MISPTDDQGGIVMEKRRSLRGWRGAAALAGVVVLQMGLLLASAGPASAQLPPEGGSSIGGKIVDRAKQEYANTSRNKEVPLGSGCNFYTGQMRSDLPVCSGSSAGFKSNNWCAEFVWYVWKNSGADVEYVNSWAESLYWHGEHLGTYHAKSGYTPMPGDAIIYDYNPPFYPHTWNQDGDNTPDIDHVGIVEYFDGTSVHTIEGNYGDKITKRTISPGTTAWSQVIGYITPTVA
jgi:hypothetical protein